jgi:hypothetical protein
VSEGGHGSDNTVSDTGDEGENRGRPSNRVPVSPLKGDTGRADTVSASPDVSSRSADDEDIPL